MCTCRVPGAAARRAGACAASPAALAEVLARFSRLDVMVHNAGISSRALVKNINLHVHKRIMDVNYFGAVALTHAVLKANPRVVVVSSVTGKIGSPMRSAYAAWKFAARLLRCAALGRHSRHDCVPGLRSHGHHAQGAHWQRRP